MMCGVCGIPSTVSWSPESYLLREHCLLEYLQLHLQYQALLPEVLDLPSGKPGPTRWSHQPQQMSTVLRATSWSPEGSAWSADGRVSGAQSTAYLEFRTLQP